MLHFTEKPNEWGRYWTWVHWELEVNTFDFVTCDEVLCRAWDWSQNTQPAEMTWTLLGQGNNSQFRLKVHKEVDEQARPACYLLISDTGKAPVCSCAPGAAPGLI